MLRVELDEIDRAIVALLVQDGRRTIRDIAGHVNLSAAPVQRRLHRLEQSGVIVGYTALLSSEADGAGMEAFAELRYSGDMEIDEIFSSLTSQPEVVAAYTTAGDADAFVHLRVRDVAHLQQVINRLRKEGNVVGTKTRIVLERRSGDQPVRAGDHPRLTTSTAR